MSSGAEPVGSPLADHLFSVGFAAGLVLAGRSARPWTWWWVSLVAAGLASGWIGIAAALGALALCAGWANRRVLGAPTPQNASGVGHALVGGLVGGLAAQGLLHGTDLGFHGSSAIVAAIGALPLVISGIRGAAPTTRRRVAVLAATTGVGVAVIGIGFAIALQQARPSIEDGRHHLDAGVAAAAEGDEDAAETHLEAASQTFERADGWLSSWWARPAEALPIAGYNARASATLVETAASLTEIGANAARDRPSDALTVRDGRIDLEGLRSLEDPLARIVTALDVATQRSQHVDGPWLAAPLADRLDEATTRVDEMRGDAGMALDTARHLPSMLGADQPRRWFVAFVTPVEARGRSGFMGNYAELVADNGDVEMTNFGRAQDLTEGGDPTTARLLTGPEDYLTRWERFDVASDWRNVTMSPDFPRVAEVIAQLYPQSGGQDIDGVIALDPQALATLLRFTGPVDVPGVAEPLTAENAADFLLEGQYLDFPDVDQRTDALESFARTTFDQLTSAELDVPPLADELSDAARAGHIQLFSADPNQQRLLSRAGLDGALPATPGNDLVAVVNNNAVGNKVDLFLSRQVGYDAQWDPATGAVSAELTVTLTNAAPTAGLPDYVIGNSLGDKAMAPGTNRTHLSVYTPLDLVAAQLDGQAAALESHVEAGRPAYSLFLDVPPEGGQRRLTLSLQGQLQPGGPYRLDVATQPLVTPDEIDLAVEVVGGDVATASPRLSDRRPGVVGFEGPLRSAVNSFRVDADE